MERERNTGRVEKGNTLEPEEEKEEGRRRRRRDRSKSRFRWKERKNEGRGCEERKVGRERGMEREDAADAEQKLSPSPSGFAAARRGAFHPPFEPRATHHPRRRSLRPSRATTKPPYTNP